LCTTGSNAALRLEYDLDCGHQLSCGDRESLLESGRKVLFIKQSADI
jgi:hypothetical protein